MSGTLPNWIARLLGEEAGAGEGTAWSLKHDWPWPPWVTFLFAVFAMIFVVAIYLRECRRARGPYRMMLAAVRLALVAVVLLMIAQVSLSLKRTGLPYVAVIVDVSGSMKTTSDRYDDDLRVKLEERIRQIGLGELSRWNLAKTLLVERDGALLAGIEEGYKLRVYFLDDSPGAVRSAKATELDALIDEIHAIDTPSVGSTRLGTAVDTVLDDLRGTAPAAIVLLTDGINTDGPPLADAAETARGKGVPLLVVGIGSDMPDRDLQLSDLLVDREVFVDDVVNFAFQVTGTGFRGRKVPVVLREEGKSEVLTKTEITVGDDGQARHGRLTYRPAKAGTFRYVVEILPQEGEAKTTNNRDGETVVVSDEKIRVMLVQAYPGFEFRYLWNLLHRDPRIEVRAVLQEADFEVVQNQVDLDRKKQEQTLDTFPVRREELFEQDVIILGDVNPARLTDAMIQDLVDFVDRPVDQQGKGGALVFIAGPKYMPGGFRDTPLARLMPIDLAGIRYPDPDEPITEGFQLQRTQLGAVSPPMQLGETPQQTETIWRELPPLYWFLETPDLKPGARVLAVHPSRRGHDGRPLPIVCMQYVGAGKTVFHATDETHRWRHRIGDAYFARYWVQMIRYLARSKLARGDSAVLEADQEDYPLGEPVRLRVRFDDPRAAPAEDDGVTVVLTHAGHKTREIRLYRAGAQGVFEQVLDKLPAGSYHASVAVPAVGGRADFTITAPQGESQGEPIRTTSLRRAAEHGKGRFYTFAEADRLLADLPSGEQVPIESLPRKPLWNRWPVLLLFLGLLGVEWVLRKLGGMV